ncbi:DEAD/DEAH box helicase [Curtobacterium sp. MCBD17_003]|uniref:DEAD/DEAH box helicase n=1 Tax=Curtobacterium sp. MCBD17_003 TaxID=2175667 RepID=UPI0015E8B936|nr:DEAD/DEAH box helicase [Curtobacterium sp. MCBD17_003]WIE55693.1 DEAD/DEAH box helicase [Curtobacterium sp. MCBD17_003]
MPAPLVDAVDVIRLVGPRPFGRAKDLVRAGGVLGTRWDDADETLAALVQGSGPEPYQVSVHLTPTRGPFSRPGRNTCTCPIGGDCKHVAAALLEVTAAAVRRDPGLTGAAGLTGLVAPTGLAATAVDDAVAVPPEHWRTALGSLAGDPGPSSARTIAMGLQFELRDLVPQRLARAAAGRDAARSVGSRVRLGVRPVTRSAAGNWVRGQLTWGSLPYSRNRLGADPDQHAWFLQFAALHRSAHAAYAPGESDWLFLDEFASPLLWPLLHEAERLGIALVAAGAKAAARGRGRSASAGTGTGTGTGTAPDPTADTDARAVVVGREARVVLDASRTSDGVQLGALALVDGRPIPPGAAGAIGTHGVYAFRRSPALHITLAPTPTPLREDQRRLLTTGDRITVPPADVDEFLHDVSPRLRGSVDLVSADGSLELPDRTPPEFVLTVTFEPEDRVLLSWRWHVDGRRDLPAAHGPIPDLSEVDGPPGVRWPSRTGVDPVRDRDRGGDVDVDGSDADDGDSDDGDQVLDGSDAIEFTTTTLPTLQARDDLRVRIVGERPDYRELTDRPKLTLTTMPSPHRDWFDLGFLVTVEGRTVPFTPLLEALAKRERKLKLIDNTYMSLQNPVFDELKRLIDEATELDEWEPGRYRISPYQAALWSEFDQLADETVQDAGWRETVEGLLRFQDATDDDPVITAVSVPESVHAELRPYQREGLAWLTFLYEHGLGGVLADDMGLGKTLQTLAFVAGVRERERARAGSGDAAPDRSGGPSAAAPDRRPFLVVAPTSVVGNWVTEAARFTPSLVVRGVTATTAKRRRMLRDAAAEADVVVTSYALFRLDAAAYRQQEWAGLVLDEAQFVKNRTSQANRLAADLPAPFKLAITGTPLENGLMDLWSIFSVVAPGLLSSVTRFTDDVVKPVASPDLTPEQRADVMGRLRRRIRPLMLRRTKESVAADLPEKVEQVLHVDLDPEHRALYDRTLQRERLKVLDLLDDMDRHRMIVFRSLTLLRMLALSPALIDPDSAVPSAKLDLLLDDLAELEAEGRRALVFSQFTSFLRLVAAGLDARGVAYEYLDGSTTGRAAVIDRFKQGSAPAFLISLKAGGFGLNLTEADTVFVLDPWWNPAAEAQAIDRAHRIGQRVPVSVHRLIAQDTIEDKVLALATRKGELFDAVIDEDDTFSGALTAEDVRGLLE